MEVDQELLNRAIAQAIASVALEEDIAFIIEEDKKNMEKVLVLKGNKNGRMGRLCY